MMYLAVVLLDGAAGPMSLLIMEHTKRPSRQVFFVYFGDSLMVSAHSWASSGNAKGISNSYTSNKNVSISVCPPLY